MRLHSRWWPSRKRSARQFLLSSVKALPYVALCASVLALGLIAGFILASPLAPQVCQRHLCPSNTTTRIE